MGKVALFSFLFLCLAGSYVLASDGFRDTEIGYVHEEYYRAVKSLAANVEADYAYECALSSQVTNYYATMRYKGRRQANEDWVPSEDSDFDLASDASVMHLIWLDVTFKARLNGSTDFPNSTSQLATVVFESEKSANIKSAIAEDKFNKCNRMYKAARGN